MNLFNANGPFCACGGGTYDKLGRGPLITGVFPFVPFRLLEGTSFPGDGGIAEVMLATETASGLDDYSQLSVDDGTCCSEDEPCKDDTELSIVKYC